MLSSLFLGDLNRKAKKIGQERRGLESKEITYINILNLHSFHHSFQFLVGGFQS
jgi:hypothetical protein